jgi:hypothetical protein
LGLVIGANVQAPLIAGTDYQIPLTAGTNYIVPNGAITGATKTKITFDTKGLITEGVDATTADIAPSSNRNYVTDVQSGVISNTSGINTGDETTSSIKSKLDITTLSGSNTGDQINITGNAATSTTATTAGNITATSNTTLTSVSNLNTVGTITSGVWSGTTVAVEKGGTGLTAAGTAGQILTSTGSGTLAWTTPSTTATAYSGTLPVANGGTGASTLTANNVLLGNGTSALQAVAPGTNGNILTSNGITWISAAPSTTHTIGESYGGGKVFYVTTDGLHGLIAETQDQSSSCTWYKAQDVISNPNNHSTEGKKFTDWRLPTQYELNLMYNARSTIGGFAGSFYWSSTEHDYAYAWYQNWIHDGGQYGAGKNYTYYVRAIRAF